MNERKEYPSQVMQVYKQKQTQSNYIPRVFIQSGDDEQNDNHDLEGDDVLHSEVDVDDSAVVKMEQQNKYSNNSSV